MSRILYYLILLPLSRLPLKVLYLFSDFLFLLAFRVFGYRTRVVLTNLRNSFPQKSEGEIKAIAEEFYRYFCDQLIETLRLFSISREELLERCHINNPEVLEQYHAHGKSIIIAGGHYNNWELGVISISAVASYQIMTLYHPLKDKFLNDRLQEARSRFGMKMVPTQDSRTFFLENSKRQIASIFATDQTPSNPRKAYWTMFLNQETPVFWGTESYARRYDWPIVFMKVNRVGRGYFTMDILPIIDEPKQTQQGEISEKHTRVLEEIIHENPPYWLWSHRRWKRTRPDDIPLHGLEKADN